MESAWIASNSRRGARSEPVAVSHNLKMEKYVHKPIRPTPKLTEKNIAERNDFAPARTRHTAWTDCVDIDEKMGPLFPIGVVWEWTNNIHIKYITDIIHEDGSIRTQLLETLNEDIKSSIKGQLADIVKHPIYACTAACTPAWAAAELLRPPSRQGQACSLCLLNVFCVFVGVKVGK